MSDWRVAKSLLKLRDQINQLVPNRDKSNDGTLGDAAHALRSSDHNPYIKDGSVGVVTAMDISHDPAHGVDTYVLAEYLRQRKDKRIKYVISNRSIFNSETSPWNWRHYSGDNPHDHHVHVSVKSDKAHYDDETPWELELSSAKPKDPDVPDAPVEKRNPQMNPLTIMSLLSTAMRLAPQIKGLFANGITGVTLDKIQSLGPDLLPLLEDFGGMITPNGNTKVHAIIGAIAAFASRDMVKGVQNSLNAFLADTPGFVPLVPDGLMGKGTIAAVMLAQVKGGEVIDGWFGKKTAALVGHSV